MLSHSGLNNKNYFRFAPSCEKPPFTKTKLGPRVSLQNVKQQLIGLLMIVRPHALDWVYQYLSWRKKIERFKLIIIIFLFF